MNINDKLIRMKLITNIQDTYNYLSYLVTSPNIIADIQSIQQSGNMLFSYCSDPDSSAMNIWYNNLKNGCNNCIINSDILLSSILPDNPNYYNIKIIVQILKDDCLKASEIIPSI